MAAASVNEPHKVAHLFLVQHQPQLVVGDPDALPELVVLLLDSCQTGVHELLPHLRQEKPLVLKFVAQLGHLLLQHTETFLQGDTILDVRF